MSGHAEANLSAFIESTEDLIWSVDLDFRLLTYNKALERDFLDRLGIPLSVGMRPEEMLPPGRVAPWHAFYERALSEGPFRVEYDVAGIRILDVALNPILVGGKATGISVFAKDITGRKAAEKGLQESLESLEEAERIGGLGSYVLDIASGAWTSSKVLDGLFGIDAQYGRTVDGWTALIHPDDRAMMSEYFAQVVVGERGPFDKEYRIVRQADQAIRWMHGLGKLGFDGQGRPTKMHGTIKDITSHKIAEMQLQDSEERYRLTFEQAAVGIVHTALDGRFLRCNPRFAEIVGYPIGELPGMTFQQITAPEDVAPSNGVLQRLLSGGSASATWEKRYRRKDGSPTWARVTVSKQFDGEGRALHFITVIEDINDRKTAEGRLTAAQEALRLSEERYRTAFNLGLDSAAISRKDDGRLVEVNDAFLRLTGFDRDEVIGKTAHELNAGLDPGDELKMVAAMQGSSSFRDIEVQFRKKNGTMFLGLVSAALIELDGVACTLSVIRDITETKAAEMRLAAAQGALRLSEERYRRAFQFNLDAVNINRLDDGRYIDVNDAFLKISGYSRREVIGRTGRDLDIWVDPQDRNRMHEAVRAHSNSRDLEAQFRCKDGRIMWGLMSSSLIEIDGIACVLSVTRDITEARAAEARLSTAQAAMQASEERYRAVFETSLDFIGISRLSDGTYIDANPALLEVLGYERSELVGHSSLELKVWADPRDRHNFTEVLRQGLPCRNLEALFRRKNGETFSGIVSASVIEIDGSRCIISITRDISGARAAREEIRNLAFFDPLTGLPNRRLLLDRLSQGPGANEVHRRRRALLFVDLDNFKSLNDTLGHHAGDLLLQEAALRLVGCVREYDTVARVGGDEFAVMLENLSEVSEDAEAQARIVSEKVLSNFAEPYQLAGHECHCPASIGITVFGDEAERTVEALQQAEIAMFEAKGAGRNSIRFFSPAQQVAVSARASLEEDLRHAIAARQFAMYYQPQVESGRLTGVEALIRWKDPKRGLVPPGDFIGMAEETGLILPIGEWGLETVCSQIVAWAGREETAHLTIAVNISARQFRQPRFVELMLAVLKRTGARAENLRLELTESMLLDNIEDTIGKMRELKAHGLRFSLDDFGTGYSSLSYLKRLPLSRLKIDRAFVQDILSDAASAAIAQTVLSLGRALGLSVIAEGVETEAQRVYLAGLGCYSYQGYLFSRPLPIEELEVFLKEFNEKAASGTGEPAGADPEI